MVLATFEVLQYQYISISVQFPLFGVVSKYTLNADLFIALAAHQLGHPDVNIIPFLQCSKSHLGHLWDLILPGITSEFTQKLKVLLID